MPREAAWTHNGAVALLCLFVIAAASGVSLLAQATTSLTGTVTIWGQVVPNAEVTATNTATGSARVTRTGSDGRYVFANLPVGSYTVAVVLEGFSKAVVNNVVAAAGQTATADVSLASPAAPPPPRPAPKKAAKKSGAPARIVGRDFLLQGQNEKKGYGLYSYLLFGAQATAATRDRYIQAMQAYLGFAEAGELAKQVPATQLNVTYVPLRARPNSLTADLLIDKAYYDFTRAQVLLAKIPGAPYSQGPYIVSTIAPLTVQTAVSDHYLFQDLSSVPGEVVPLWVQEFVSQSAQQDFWRARNGPHAALELRTAIARLAAGIDPAKRSAKEWQGILSALLFWKGQ